MTPAVEAHAFMIWAHAKRRGWSVSRERLSELTGLPQERIAYVIRVKGWGGRFRRVSSERGSRLAAHRRGFVVDLNDLDLCEPIQ